MDLPGLLAARYSCRAFKRELVADETLDELFGLAQRTPSWCNVQPWHVHLTSGPATARFAQALSEHVSTSEPKSDIERPTVYSEVYQKRRRETGHQLYGALGIDRADAEGRRHQMLQNFTFFGAPHVAVITSDRDQGPYGAVDCGGYVNTLLLAAQHLGLGAVAQGAIAAYSDFVRTWLDIPDDQVVVCAVSFGYADEQHPVNGFRTDRAEAGGVVSHRAK
ncbi:nitroreductase [Nocardioides sp. WS12]|uniref:nitroreductase n=1 Tax=Nocardioides sp. WS12 TaxID=2486272 RepID=UPI001F26AC89|nr:nitroreductase [Nocardioides sp. WS12]